MRQTGFPEETPNFAPIDYQGMPVDLKKLANKLRDSYTADRNKIRDTIIVAEKPDANIDITSAITRSTGVLGNYATLDWQHRVEIIALVSRIRQYAEDKNLTRPLNVVMQAESGSGKSHFIKCLAENTRLVSLATTIRVLRVNSWLRFSGSAGER